MSDTPYTYITFDSTGMTTSADNKDVNTYDTTQALVDDINQIYADEYKLGLSQDDLDAAIGVMVGDSGTESLKGLIDIIGVLTIECNSISGALVIINDTMNVISDVTNLVSIAMTSYTSLADNFSEYTTVDEAYKSTYYTSGEANKDLQTFVSAIDVFTFTTFTVHENGTTTNVTGLLNLLSTPDYWPGGYAPMGSQTADLIETSIDGIEDIFGDDWYTPTTNYYPTTGNFSAMMTDIITWSEPKPYTDSDGSESGIYGSYTQNSDIEQDMNAIDDQLTTTTSTLQNYESEGMALYQQFQAYEEDDIQSIQDQQATMISNQLA